jgi:hypothetical protein
MLEGIMRLPLPIALSVLGLVAALSGCQCTSPEVTETPDAAALPGGCAVDADCPDGEGCVDGACQPPTSTGEHPCSVDADCPAPLACLVSAGICVMPSNYDGGEADAGEVGDCVDGESRPCGVSKLGQCRLGVEVCMTGAWMACSGAVYPASEGCDGKDNDCNGLVDDGYDKLNDPDHCGTCGRVCSYPNAKALCVNGDCAMGACLPSHWDLNGDPADGCEYACALTNGGTETCDGLDNDCDGLVDEDLGSTTCGVGACQTMTANCVGGIPQTCQPLPPSPEICDGLDNDCDGSVDEDQGVKACGQGECKVTVAACLGGVSQTCTPKAPTAEICDTKDNNCDGVVDEGCACVDGATQSCYSGSAGTAGLGMCKAGTQTCSGGQWGTCAGEVVDAPEACDGVDNDCNGLVDDGLGSTSCGAGACQVTVQNCVGGTPQTCTPGQPSAEICDGVDNDCNGAVDDGLGTTSCGTGACQVTVAACTNGAPTPCMPGSPSLEVCDGVDNNCNGAVDESFPQAGETCSTGLFGPCGAGIKVCTSGAIQCQQTVFPAAQETCGNNVDDDCNGTVDDPTQCGCDPTIDYDLDGHNECVDCNDQDATVNPGVVELCDGKDNNCNGAIDETFDQDGDGFTSCGTVPGGGLDPARVDCNDNNAFVFPGKATDCGGPATPSSPNGVDDNCNGYVDETCNCSSADNDGDGYSQCTGDCNDNDASVHPGATEQCDGKDNDCNRRTTESCEVSDPCGYKQGNSWYPWPSGTDKCKPDLICTYTVDGTGKITDMTCGSFCNQTLGSGVGDSCAAGQACNRTLLDSDALNLCGKLTVGSKLTGATCGVSSECRTGVCRTESSQSWCTDRCTHEAGCSANTTCTPVKSPLGFPQTTGHYYYSYCKLDGIISGTKTTGQACSGSDCRAGVDACFQGACVEPCCEHADCPSGFSCSLEGPRSNTGYTSGGAQVWSLLPACVPSTGTRVSGQACVLSTECRSGLCDKNLGICLDVCCNDSSCPNGTTCEPVNYKLAGGQVSFIRACVFSPVPAQLEQK